MSRSPVAICGNGKSGGVSTDVRNWTLFDIEKWTPGLVILPRGSVGAACPGSAQEGPARCAATATSLAARRAGGSCVPTWASSWSCRDLHARRHGRRLQQAGAPLLAHPVAVPANAEDVAVMEQAVEDGRCHHGVAEHRSPLAARPLAGEHPPSPLLAPRCAVEG